MVVPHGVYFVHGEASADDRVAGRARAVLDIRGGDKGAVEQSFQAWIATVASSIAVQELDAVLARSAMSDVVVGANPGDKMSTSGAVRRLVPKGNNRLPICLAGNVDHAKLIWSVERRQWQTGKDN